MIKDPELDRLIDTPKVNCDDCPLLNPQGRCTLYNYHRNYIIKCEWLEVPLHLANDYYRVMKRN